MKIADNLTKGWLFRDCAMAGLNSLQRKLKQKITNVLQSTDMMLGDHLVEEPDGNFVQFTFDEVEVWVYKDLVECVTKQDNGHCEFELSSFSSENELIDKVMSFVGDHLPK